MLPHQSLYHLKPLVFQGRSGILSRIGAQSQPRRTSPEPPPTVIRGLLLFPELLDLGSETRGLGLRGVLVGDAELCLEDPDSRLQDREARRPECLLGVGGDEVGELETCPGVAFGGGTKVPDLALRVEVALGTAEDGEDVSIVHTPMVNAVNTTVVQVPCG